MLQGLCGLTARSSLSAPTILVFGCRTVRQYLLIYISTFNSGDIDICIMNVDGDAVTNLRVLTLCLTKLGIPLAVEVISSARVPIVKFVDSETGVPVDISLNTDSAITTSNYVMEHVCYAKANQL